RKDLNQAFSVYAPEFTQVEVDGKVSKLDQIRQFWQQNLPKIRQINVMRENQIQINGQTATVLGTGYQTAIVSNPKNPQVPVPRYAVFQYQDTWKRTNLGWKATNAHLLQSNVA
ncbi:MAG: nuclear transport factor 2 family protein, partial [Nostoc sp.]